MYFDHQDIHIATTRLNDKNDKTVSADEFFKELER